MDVDGEGVISASHLPVARDEGLPRSRASTRNMSFARDSLLKSTAGVYRGLVRDVAHLASTGPGQPSQRISMSLPTETALREVSGT